MIWFLKVIETYSRAKHVLEMSEQWNKDKVRGQDQNEDLETLIWQYYRKEDVLQFYIYSNLLEPVARPRGLPLLLLYKMLD